MTDELYRRTSRLCSIEVLDSRLRAAVLAAAEVEHLDEALETLIACVETHSVPRRRPGLLTHVMGRGLRPAQWDDYSPRRGAGRRDSHRR